MAQTLSTPESRARRHRVPTSAPSSFLEIGLLVLAASIAVGAVLLAATAKEQAMAREAARGGPPPLDLNLLTAAEQLAPLLRVFPDERERSFVAKEIVAHVTGAGTGPTAPRELPNVGALARLTVEGRRLAATPGLPTLQARMLEQRRRGAGDGPERLPLLTPAQVAAIKPALAVRDAAAYRRALALHVGLVLLAFAVVAVVRRARGATGDAVLLPALLALSGLGLALMVSLRDPVRDLLLFAPFAQGVAVGCGCLLAVSLVDLERSVLPRLSYVPLAAALVLSALLVTLGSGPTGSDARVNLFGVQPVDAIRLLVTLFLAGYFARRWELLRELRDSAVARTRWGALRVPRRQDVVPVLVALALVLVAFFLQKDLGPALMVACVFLALYGVARGAWVVAAGGLLLLVAGFVAGYVLRISSTLVARIEIWRAPWDNGARGGDQVAQALWALASGGWRGTGLGRGMPEVVPAAHTDLVLAAAGEQLGFAGLLALAGLFAVVVARGFAIARRASGEYSSLLAVGLTAGLAVPVLLIAGGLLGVVPLTGVVTPFLSYGRSALVANFVAVGLLLAIADRASGGAAASPFAGGIRRLGYLGAALAAALLVRAGWTQVYAADEVMAAAALTRQGDGQRRYSYNPRLLEAAQAIVRGAIADRSGMPLATSRPEDLVAYAAAFAGLGLNVPAACGAGQSRCYPLGGATFHLLGDATTQVNWAASNTSFVERDRDTRLRGYDDQAQLVEVVDPRDGSRSRVLRRNLAVLLPLWKHRDDPDHPDVRALLDVPRDVRLSIDARLQWRVATLVRDRIAAARLRRGAAVVVDAVTGELLAATSVPWPADPSPSSAAPSPEAVADALLDRARYGVYPPGSTFKLVTAAAALRSRPALASEPLVCRRLDDGRVGNVVAGWRRPVRDDVAVTQPHGDVTLDRGLIQSCNAYFAQLGARLGARALQETAASFDIALTPAGNAARLRDTLPFAAYGQGDVLATPLRMARVAAAIAADGRLAPARLVIDGGAAGEAAAARVLDAGDARRLGDAMRQVVVAGTARGLVSSAVPVAGKTGTAEVDKAASHSWFVGFAPHGEAAGRRIAFAVIVENGGYGGRVAAPIAGEIVSVARELGLIGPPAGASGAVEPR